MVCSRIRCARACLIWTKFSHQESRSHSRNNSAIYHMAQTTLPRGQEAGTLSVNVWWILHITWGFLMMKFEVFNPNSPRFRCEVHVKSPVYPQDLNASIVTSSGVFNLSLSSYIVAIQTSVVWHYMLWNFDLYMWPIRMII